MKYNNFKNEINKCQSNSVPEGIWQEAKLMHA